MPQAAPRHSVSVAGAVVREDGRVLAIQRADNGRWEPPGGVLEIGETVEAGLRREILEETGLVVEPEALTGVYKNMRAGVVALFFRCQVTGGAATVTNETQAFRWLDPSEIKGYMNEAYAVRVLDALDAAGPHVRSHDGTQLLP
ncbi:NUDIX hydrolase [Streptomyces sp. NPDC002536]|uniref:NUDIX hydrolase n=1 Tax=Streptomyces sp. NPDC001262 TaxID=3364552 RepID=UPI0036A5AD5F